MIKLFPTIKDFVLIYHNQSELFKQLLEFKVRQIYHFYPNSNIHIMSDVNYPFNFNAKWHIININKDNYLHKFQIFDLLDVPCMYLDLDVFLTRPFNSEELKCNHDFKVFNIFPSRKWYRIPEPRRQWLINSVPFYNLGVIWINKPNPISSTLQKIHNKHFQESLSDEHSVSFYLYERHIKFKPSKTVNLTRMGMENIDMKVQSIHYPGNSAKDIAINEMSLFPPRVNISP